MRQDIKERWLAKLREPDRVQGYQRLRADTPEGKVAQCCLDLLCEIAVEDGIIDPPIKDKDRGWEYFWASQEFGDVTETMELPYLVVVWAEFTTGNPSIVMDNGVYTSLAELNDGSRPWDSNTVRRHTFIEISDIIEAKL